MSENMADKMKRQLSAKSITAVVVFGAIILVFVFSGLTSHLGGGAGSAAVVNSALISLADFSESERRLQSFYESQYGGMDLSSQRQQIRQEAIQSLVAVELQSQVAEKNGILTTDAEVRDYIVHEIPEFQQAGQFQREYYMNYLQGTRTNAASLEAKIRKQITGVRTRHLFEAANVPSQLQIAKALEARSHKVNVLFAKIAADAPEATVKALEEALAKGDEAAVNAQLKELKVSWEETGLTPVESEYFPKISSQSANQAIFDLHKDQPLLKRLVRDSAGSYVLKLKESKMEKVAAMDPLMVEMMQKQGAGSMLNAWLQQFRANSKVTINSAVLQLN